jgi:replicative DNA helicase
MAAAPASSPFDQAAHNEAQGHEAERMVLGAVLVSPTIYPTVAHLAPEVFATRRHQRIWESIQRLDEQGQPVDLVTLKHDLEKHGRLAEVGGAGYLAALLDGVPRQTNVETWAAIVRERSNVRKVRAAGNEILQLAKSPDADGSTILERGLEILTSAALTIGTEVDLDVAAGIDQAMRDLEASANGEAAGFTSGIALIDQRIGPLTRGQVVIIGARTGVGKSTLLANIGDAVAAQGGSVLLFSAEMSAAEINRRRLLAHAGVSSGHFEPNGITATPKEWERVARANEALRTRPFFVEASAPTPTEMRAKSRYVKAAACGLDVVLADYIQLFPAGQGKRGETREAEVARVSRALKRLAMDLDVVVIAASQLNREFEQRKDGRPRLSDLRESGSLEQDADVVLLLHGTDDDRDGVEFQVAKHRNRGRSSWLQIGFDGASHRFHDPEDR